MLSTWFIRPPKFSTASRIMREKSKLALTQCARAQWNAEQRTESAENSLREVVVDADRKLADASRALTQVERRITAAVDEAAAAEIRAQVAEAEAREAKQTLALVEDAIRRRLLC